MGKMWVPHHNAVTIIGAHQLAELWLQLKHLFGTSGPSRSMAETTIKDGSSDCPEAGPRMGASVNSKYSC